MSARFLFFRVACQASILFTMMSYRYACEGFAVPLEILTRHVYLATYVLVSSSATSIKPGLSFLHVCLRVRTTVPLSLRTLRSSGPSSSFSQLIFFSGHASKCRRACVHGAVCCRGRRSPDKISSTDPKYQNSCYLTSYNLSGSLRFCRLRPYHTSLTVFRSHPSRHFAPT